MKKYFPLLICVIFITVSAATFTACDMSKGYLIGVWLDRNHEGAPWQIKPRMEFNADGSFRLQTPLGQIQTGSWKWTARDTIEVHYPDHDKTIKIIVAELLQDSLRLVIDDQEMQYKKVQSWTAE